MIAEHPVRVRTRHADLPLYEIPRDHFDRGYIFSYSLRLENGLLNARTELLPRLAVPSVKETIDTRVSLK